MARLAWGTHSMLLVTVPAAAFALVFGAVLGIAAARVGRLGDRLVTRMIEVVGGFPTIILVALLRAMTPHASLWVVAATLALVRVPETVRLVRLLTVRFRASERYTAVRALGASPWRIYARHLFPSTASSLASAAVTSIGVLLGVEATMTFVGLPAPVAGPSWGGDIGRALGQGNLIATVPPACMILLTLGATFRLSERLRHRFARPEAGSLPGRESNAGCLLHFPRPMTK